MTTDPTNFLKGTEGMASRIRSFDWSATSLGPIEDWPQCLKTATGLIVQSPVPIVMLWGGDGVMIYNDAYAEFAGRGEPQRLGKKVIDAWPEVASFNSNVMRVGLAGGTLAYKDQELTLHRRGQPEQVWMNLDYSPVLDEWGHPAGVIAIVIETTQRVLADRRDVAERERLRNMFEQAPGFMALFEGPQHVIASCNPAYVHLAGRQLVVGQSIRQALPEVEGQGFFELLDECFRTGQPFVGTGLKVGLRRTSQGPGLLQDALVYALVMIGGVGIGYGQALLLFRMGISIVTQLKTRMFEHVLRLGLDFHEQYSPGRLISRVESDAETLQQLFSDATVNLLRNLVYFIGILVTLCLKNFSIAVWILVLVPPMFGATAIYISKMKRWWREARAQNAKVLGYVTEYVQGVDVIQQFNYEETAKQRMKEVSLDKYKIEAPASVMDYGFWGAFGMGEIFAMVAVLLIGVDRVFAGTMTIGTLIMFFEYIRQMFQPIQQLSEQLNFLNRSMISVERVVGVLEQNPNVTDGPADPSELKFEHEIRFEDVWFAYEEENWVLQGVSFVIPRGQRIALAGKSGGGKSTVVSLLLRFYDPQKGRILVDGRDIRDFPVAAWRSLCGLVLQDVYLFPGSVGDNLKVFNNEVPQERIERFAKLAHADEIIAKIPAGYEGELAERGRNLSAGERQLISFARALAASPHESGPPLLVLDEATSSVDPHTERLVQDALDQLLAGRTAVIVAHRLSTILNANCIILIKDGQIAEQGTHDELIARNGIYAKLFKLQFSGSAAPTGAPITASL